MARVKRAVHAKKKHKKVLDRAKGYKGARSRRFKTANEQVMHARTPTATAAPARASSGGCGSSASTPRPASTGCRTPSSWPA